MVYARIDTTPDTDEWLQERRRSVGASEAAALIGASSYGETPHSLYLSKIGRGRPFDPLLSLIGHGAEPLIAEWVRRFHPEIGEVSDGFMARRPDAPWLHATFDRLVTRDGVTVPLQLKTSSVYVQDKWFDGPPVDYLVQEDVECFIADAPFAWLAVWHTGTTNFELHKIVPDRDRQEAVSEKAREFMGLVESRTQPPYTLGDDLAAMYPVDDSERVITADGDTYDAVMALDETAAMRRATEREFKASEAVMLHEIEMFMSANGHANVLVGPDGKTIHTWKQDKNGNRRHYSPGNRSRK